jgi:hypothetical protein
MMSRLAADAEPALTRHRNRMRVDALVTDLERITLEDEFDMPAR